MVLVKLFRLSDAKNYSENYPQSALCALKKDRQACSKPKKKFKEYRFQGALNY
jgi:hypothetical protein